MTSILAAACLVVGFPTPSLTWDPLPLETVEGYSLWSRLPGQNFSKLTDLPCQPFDSDGDEIDDSRFCRGGEFPVPVQRYRGEQGFEVDFAVDAWNEFGRSPALSNVVRVCMPQTWQPGEVYE